METVTETPPVVSSSRQLFWIKYTHLSTKVGKDFKSQLEYDHPEKPNFNSVGFTIVTEFSETEFGITTGMFNGLPAGLSIGSNLVISGVPKETGYFFIKLFQHSGIVGVGEINVGAFRLSVELGDPVLLTNLVKASVSTEINQLFQFSTNSNYNAGTITSATGLPAGFYFDGNRLKGSHTTAGTFKVKVFFIGPVTQPVFSKEITILNYEAAPSIFTSSLPSGKVGQGYSAELFIESSNSPADSWSASGLPLGLVFSNGKISGAPSVFGEFDVLFTATNPLGSNSKTLRISIAIGSPSILSQSFSVKKAEAFSQQVAIDNATNRPVDSWSASGLPDGLTINATTGLVTGTPTASGKYTATIFAIGPGGSVSSEVVFLVRQAFSGKYGDDFSSIPLIFEPGSPTLWEGVSGLPPGLALNQSTGEITGIPTATGEFLAVIKITLQTEVEIFRGLDFLIAFGAPIIAPDQFFGASLNVPFLSTPALEEETNRPATAWLASGLPPWATINPLTGEITGTPTYDDGPISALITATGPGGSSQAEIIIDTTGGIPILVDNQVFTGKVGILFTPVIPESVDSANRPILSWQAFGLPAGLIINSTTGEISGTPLVAGRIQVGLIVTGEGGLISTASVTFVVDFGDPILSPDQNCLFKFGVPFAKQFRFQDVNNRPVTAWSASGLPEWAALDSATGLLTGNAASIGISTFTLTATGGGGSTSEVITLAISAGVPKLTAGESVAGIATAFLSFNPTPVDTLNRPITSWSAKGLPTGVSISASTGEITGTPLLFWSAPAKITAVGPGGSVTEDLLFEISRLPRTTNVQIFAASNVFPLEVSGSRKVQVFSTNLVLVSLEYIVPRNDEYIYSKQFKAGAPLLTDSPAVDGLFIFPESSRQDMGNGFVKFMVSAYGRTSTEWNSSLRFVSLGSPQTFLTAVTIADEPFPFNALGEKRVISTNIQNFGRFNEFQIVAK